MVKNIYLFVVVALFLSLSACSEDDPDVILNHDLDNTVWLKEKILIDDQRDYLDAIIFANGYFQNVCLEKTTGSVLRVEYVLKYTLDKSGERILLFKDQPDGGKDGGISFKHGVVHWNGYDYYQRVI